MLFIASKCVGTIAILASDNIDTWFSSNQAVVDGTVSNFTFTISGLSWYGYPVILMIH